MPINYQSQTAKYRKYYEAIGGFAKTPKNRAYTTTIFSFLAVSLFGWYAIRPTLQTILYLRREIIDKTDISKKMEEKISNLIGAQATYQSVENQLPLLDAALPTNPEAVSLVQQIKKLADTTNATITSIQVASVPILTGDAAPVETKNTPATGAKSLTEFKTKTFNFSVILVGGYPTLKSFLDGIMNMRRVVAIDSMNFIPTSDAEATVTTDGRALRLVLKLHSYYLSK